VFQFALFNTTKFLSLIFCRAFYNVVSKAVFTLFVNKKRFKWELLCPSGKSKVFFFVSRVLGAFFRVAERKESALQWRGQKNKLLAAFIFLMARERGKKRALATLFLAARSQQNTFMRAAALNISQHSSERAQFSRKAFKPFLCHQLFILHLECWCDKCFHRIQKYKLLVFHWLRGRALCPN
jgi:hypothetical protein